jgi:hypothetical protein
VACGWRKEYNGGNEKFLQNFAREAEGNDHFKTRCRLQDNVKIHFWEAKVESGSK